MHLRPVSISCLQAKCYGQSFDVCWWGTPCHMDTSPPNEIHMYFHKHISTKLQNYIVCFYTRILTFRNHILKDFHLKLFWQTELNYLSLDWSLYIVIEPCELGCDVNHTHKTVTLQNVACFHYMLRSAVCCTCSQPNLTMTFYWHEM